MEAYGRLPETERVPVRYDGRPIRSVRKIQSSHGRKAMDLLTGKSRVRKQGEPRPSEGVPWHRQRARRHGVRRLDVRLLEVRGRGQL